MHEVPNLSVLSHADKDALIVAQSNQLLAALAIVEELRARIAELEARLGKDSHNSSKPPSSDEFRKKPKSLRESSGRKPGGQSGHGGSTLKRAEMPDRIVNYPIPKRCEQCGESLKGESVQPDRRQVFDLVRPVLEVTEHRGFQVICGCGHAHGSAFPAHVGAPLQYGPLIKSTLVYLTQQQLLPMQRTTELMFDLTGVKLSTATVHASIAQAAQMLTIPVQRIATAIQACAVVHFDETGQRVMSRLHWFHTATTERLCWYGTHEKRGAEAMDEFGILPRFCGIAVHDGWSPYRKYACSHGLCNAHHLRELIYLKETIGQVWPSKMIRFLCRAKNISDAARLLQQPLTQPRLAGLHRRYETILAEGERHNRPSKTKTGQRGRIKQTTAVNLLRRLRRYTDDVLRFLYDPRVPFDNNLAERSIRMPKLKQKTSGCFRTVLGAHAFATIRSYVATLRKQRRDVMHALTLTFLSQPPDPLPAG
jgi:transposase